MGHICLIVSAIFLGGSLVLFAFETCAGTTKHYRSVTEKIHPVPLIIEH
jgi:hypothetical protein